MTTAIRRRRGTTTQHSTFTGLDGELTVDTTKKTVVVHDGATAGGHPLAREADVLAKTGGTVTGDLTVEGSTTLGDASADTVTINGTVQPGVVIEGSSSSAALRITQTGAGNALVVEDSANPDATPFVIDNNGNVVSGHTSQLLTVASLAGGIQSVLGNNQIAFSGYRFGDDTTGPQFVANKARGTVTSPTIVANGDNIGQFWWAGYDGSAYIRAASIIGAVDGTPGTGDMPGRLVFSTTADGASSPTERMRITNDGRIGIGSSVLTGYNVRIQSNTTGATSAATVVSTPTILSDVTNVAYNFWSQPVTQAAAFTLGQLQHFRASQGTIGASSAITSQFGFWADSNLTGATNNYGFFGNIPSGTGRWNFYANGTADNYFAGNVGIGTTTTNPISTSQNLAIYGSATASTTLRTAAGSGGYISTDGSTYVQLIAQASTASLLLGTNNTERMRIDTSGNVGIGVTAPGARLDVVGGYIRQQTQSNSVTGNNTQLWTNSSSTADFGFYVDHYNNSVVDARMTLGGKETVGTITFNTNTAGNAAEERMRIDSSGNVGIGTSAPVNKLDVTGSFGRGAPVTKTGNFTLAATENWIICNGTGSITVTLPAASSWTGRELTIKTIAAQTVVSNASNVVPLAGGAAGTAILAATAGKFATLVSDGTNWVIMAGN